MSIGSMDRRVVIQSYTTTKDDWNYDVATWENYRTCWAAVQDRFSNEITGENQLVGVTRTVFTIRWYDGLLNGKFRVVMDGDIYWVTGIQNLGRRKYIRLTTELRDNG